MIEQLGQRRFYSIGQVARLTGLPVKTIRYYAEIDLLPPARLTESGYRQYTAREIWQLELIRTLRFAGFSLEEIGRILGGDLPVAEAIELQLEALDNQIQHLSRVRSILIEAQRSGGDSDLASYLHDLGEAMRVSLDERRHFLESWADRAIGGPDVPADWRSNVLKQFGRDLPEKLTAEQSAAWRELQELMSDREAAESLRQEVEPFWESVRQSRLPANDWNQGMEAIQQRAIAALRAGAGPESDIVQAIVRDWAALFAAIRGREADDVFLASFAKLAPRFVDERSAHITDLIEILRGNPPGEATASHRLLLDGLIAWTTKNL
ncbi:MAG TPA: MerR family transcriptional regulator [Thermomicrobiaceae bacterium]|nr:MerR family transcriptional regulator [Thermomicrobiaceae bacterium]